MAQKQDIENVNTIIVGAGPSGLLELAKVTADTAVLLLESEDRLWGRFAHGSLHLSKATPEGADFAQAKIRWEREWVDAAGFEFDPKFWALNVPQWDYYRDGSYLLSEEFAVSEKLINKIVLSSPVSKIERNEEIWFLETSDKNYSCSRLIWAAGVESFQNAYGGKEASRDFLVPNPIYNPDSRDCMGGIALNWKIQNAKDIQLQESLPSSNVLFVPVKHNKKFYLSIAVVLRNENSLSLKTLNYLPPEILKHPKEVLSFQKSLRRVLKTFFVEAAKINPMEVIIQSPRLNGHGVGMPWVLINEKDGIRFVGDETLAALESLNYGLKSVGSLKDIPAHEIEDESVNTLADTASLS